MLNGRREILSLSIILDRLSHNNMDYYFHTFLEKGALPDDLDEPGEVFANLEVLEEELNKIKDLCDDGLKLINELGCQMR